MNVRKSLKPTSTVGRRVAPYRGLCPYSPAGGARGFHFLGWLGLVSPLCTPPIRLPGMSRARTRLGPLACSESPTFVYCISQKDQQCSGWKHKKDTGLQSVINREKGHRRACRRGQLASTRYARQANTGTGLGKSDPSADGASGLQGLTFKKCLSRV